MLEKLETISKAIELTAIEKELIFRKLFNSPILDLKLSEEQLITINRDANEKIINYFKNSKDPNIQSIYTTTTGGQNNGNG